MIDFSASKPKVSISAYRVLYILLLLVQYRSLSLAELNGFLSDNPLIRRSYNSETVTKYVNTLRQVGCQIPRSSRGNNFHYELLKNPFPISFEEDELKAAHQLLLLLASQPDEEIHVSYYNILQKIVWAIGNEESEQLVFEANDTLTPAMAQHRRSLVSRYKKLCREAMVLEIEYQVDESETTSLTVEPSRVHQEGRQIFLLAMDRQTHQRVKLNLDKISNLRQLPYKIQSTVKQVLVTYELTGRMARTYRPYPDEVVVSQQDDRLWIKARTDNAPALVARLLKYGDYCQIIAPAYLRQETHQKIRDLLKSCEEEPTRSSSS